MASLSLSPLVTDPAASRLPGERECGGLSLSSLVTDPAASRPPGEREEVHHSPFDGAEAAHPDLRYTPFSLTKLRRGRAYATCSQIPPVAAHLVTSRPLHLLRQPRATLAPHRLALQPSSSPSLLASLTSPMWRIARAGPSLRMPGAGNTAACLRPRHVPGLASMVRRFNFAFVRLRIPGIGNADAYLRLRRVPGFGKPDAMLHQHRLLPGAPLLRHHCAHD